MNKKCSIIFRCFTIASCIILNWFSLKKVLGEEIFLNIHNHFINCLHISLEEGLSQSTVYSIAMDKYGRVYWATQDGINIWDGKNFFYISSELSSPLVYDIDFLNDSIAIILTEKGIDLLKHSIVKSTYELKYVKPMILRGIVPYKFTKILKILAEKNVYVLNEKEGIFTLELDTLFSKGTLTKLPLPYSTSPLIIPGNQNTYIFYPENSKLYSLEQKEEKLPAELYPGEKPLCWKDTIFLTTKRIIIGKNSFFHNLEIVNALPHPYLKNTIIGATNSQNVILISYQKENINVKILHPYQFYKFPQINKIFADKYGDIWLGTENGVFYFSLSGISSLFASIPSWVGNIGNVYAIACWHDNKIIVSGDNGLYLIDLISKNVQKIASLNSYSTSILVRNNKIIWTEENTIREGSLDKSQLKNTKTLISLPKEKIYVIRFHNNLLYMGTQNGIYAINEYGSLSVIHKENDIYCRTIIFIDTFGLFGTMKGIYIFNTQNNEIAHIFPNISDIMDIRHLDGKIIISTFGKGIIITSFSELLSKNISSIREISKEHNLSNNIVYATLTSKDNPDIIWASTNRGINAIKFKSSDVEIYSFGPYEGVQDWEFNYSSACICPSQGKDLFIMGGIKGITFFFPDSVLNFLDTFKLFSSPFTGFLSEDTLILLQKSPITSTENLIGKEIYLPILPHSIKKNVKINELVFPYLSRGMISDPQKKVFMPPVSYGTESIGFSLQLSCCHNKKWSLANISLNLDVPWWQRWYTILATIVIISTGTLGIAKWRISYIRKQKEKLEQLVNQKTKELMETNKILQREKDKLFRENIKRNEILEKFLPPLIVSSVINGKIPPPRKYQLGTILFIDFQHFTTFSLKYSLKEVVTTLESYFNSFDKILEENSWIAPVEKIKTIGDAYLAAGGLPLRNLSNPFDVCYTALKIMEYIKESNEFRKCNGMPYLEARMGINSGEVAAGIIGKSRIIYDIWGANVNTAYIMEQTSKINHIHLSANTFKYIGDIFNCTPAEQVKISSPTGDPLYINTYYLTSIREDFINLENNQPNEWLFRYKQYKFEERPAQKTLKMLNLEEYVYELLKTRLPPYLKYHVAEHVFDVSYAATLFGIMSGLTPDEIDLLRIAALLHDIGYIESAENHEIIGTKIAQPILQKFGFSQNEINQINSLILATKFPYLPKNELEAIICDADMNYLGTDDYFKMAPKLKEEFIYFKVIKDDKDFFDLQIRFFQEHKYFTEAARMLREKGKQKNYATLLSMGKI